MSEQQKLKILVTAADTELGDETLRQLTARGHQVTGVVTDEKKAAQVRANATEVLFLNAPSTVEIKRVLERAQPEVVINLWPQNANTLLHDGQKWRNQDRFLVASTTALIEALQQQSAVFLVHTSYAFLYGNKPTATEVDSISVPSNDPIFGAAIRAEKIVAASKLPASLLRLGYLYGPQSQDLKSYILSFRLSRPYYAGPEGKVQAFLHFADAATALALVAERQPRGQIFNVADTTPAYFGDFIDYFAVMSGFNRPLHIPVWANVFAQIVIAPQQMELLNQSVSISSDKIGQQLGWKSRFSNYRQGINQLIEQWKVTSQK